VFSETLFKFADALDGVLASPAAKIPVRIQKRLYDPSQLFSSSQLDTLFDENVLDLVISAFSIEKLRPFFPINTIRNSTIPSYDPHAISYSGTLHLLCVLLGIPPQSFVLSSLYKNTQTETTSNASINPAPVAAATISEQIFGLGMGGLVNTLNLSLVEKKLTFKSASPAVSREKDQEGDLNATSSSIASTGSNAGSISRQSNTRTSKTPSATGGSVTGSASASSSPSSPSSSSTSAPPVVKKVSSCSAYVLLHIVSLLCPSLTDLDLTYFSPITLHSLRKLLRMWFPFSSLL
jgi:hypothetical protein